MSHVDPDQQREFAIDVVRQLRARDFQAYWAGGCVRDRLLGLPPKDYDVATTATPAQIREIFKHRRTIAIGAAFGVITVVGPKRAGQVEVATFRQDAAYIDGRRPEAVTFSTPEADAQRRDFTINGLFFDPLENRVIDYVGGQEDLARGIVRAIGDPYERLAEDKLRLLRAVRFAAAFDFSWTLETRKAIEAMASQITVVSAERIAAELQMMLVGPRRARAMILLRETGLLKVLLPELFEISSEGPARLEDAEQTWLATVEVLQVLQSPSFSLALAALLHHDVAARQASDICRRWKLSNHNTSRVCWLIENQLVVSGARGLPWPRLQRILISDGVSELLALEDARSKAGLSSSEGVQYCRELLKLPPDELNPKPLMTGDDLIEHGVPRGPRYQWLLENVRDAQLEQRITTKVEALALVDQLLNEKGG